MRKRYIWIEIHFWRSGFYPRYANGKSIQVPYLAGAEAGSYKSFGNCFNRHPGFRRDDEKAEYRQYFRWGQPLRRPIEARSFHRNLES